MFQNKGFSLFLFILCILQVCHSLPDKRMADASIAIIGGGVAGISAAIELRKLGFQNVTIYEASGRLGGRMHPILLDDGENVIDLGAQYIHGKKGNPIYRLALKLNALAPEAEQDYNQDEQARTQHGCIIDPRIVEQMDGSARKLELRITKFVESNWTSSDNKAASSFGSAYDAEANRYLRQQRKRGKLSQEDLSYVEALLAWRKRYIELDYACPDSNLLSLNAHENLPDYSEEDAEMTLGRHGYKPILDHLVGHVPEASVQLNREVVNLKWKTTDDSDLSIPVSISMTDGELVEADHVILTVSLGYLKEHSQALFTPELPDKKQAAIRYLGYGAVGKVVLFYEEAFWPEEYRSFDLVTTDDDHSKRCSTEASSEKNTGLLPLEMFQFLDVHPWVPHCLIFWIHGSHVDEMEAATVDSVAASATWALRRYFGDSNIPPPSKLIKTDWANNPLFRGAYSWWSVDCDAQGCSPKDLAEPLQDAGVPKVLFAGEATHSSLFQTVNGAYLTGVREAKRLHRAYDGLTDRMFS